MHYITRFTKDITRADIAECIGTFVLASVVAFSINTPWIIQTPYLAALTLGLFVYMIGPISGSHINPAVTFGLWWHNKITTEAAVRYAGAQLLAGLVVFGLLSILRPNHGVMNGYSFEHLFGELLGVAVFTFGIGSVVFGKVPEHLSGVVVGGSLLLGISVASLVGSAGVLNPAVALGVGIINPIYLLVPLVGSWLGFTGAHYLNTHA